MEENMIFSQVAFFDVRVEATYLISINNKATIACFLYTI